MEGAKAARPDLHMVRRVITRPVAGLGEDFEQATAADFATRQANGDFALSWQAHGLHYGIPRQVIDVLATGQDAMFNGSRAVLLKAQEVFPTLRPILITASAETLAKRLENRGRETQADIANRLVRSTYAMPAGLKFDTVKNDGTIDEALVQLLQHLSLEEV